MVYFWIFTLSFFAVIGVCEFCKGIIKTITKSENKNGIILIEPICNKQEDAEFLLRCAAQKVKWMGKSRPDRVICLDCNMDEETKRLCEIVCKDYPFIELYTKDEILDEINKFS